MPCRARPLIALPALVLTAAPLAAQWSADPNVNLAVADRAGEQVLAKLAPDGSGGTWIGWFDHASGNYDVYVQHLDAAGQETFAHDGLLVSAHPSNSSLVDWDLMCDAGGACVLVFSDARAGSDLDVHAYRIEPSGAFTWGPDGVTLSSNADFEPAPRVCQTSDGSYVFVWARLPSASDGSIRMQRLDAAGVPQFAADGLPISGAPGEDPGFCDVVAADGGAYIVQWLRDISTIASVRHIRAQKFAADGTPLWGTFSTVYDASSVPIAHQPIVEPDGAGGAYFCWHRAVGGAFDCLVQHLDASGAEVFFHNGVSASHEAARWELDPALAVLPGGDLIVAFNKRNSTQSSWGVGAQRFDATGTPQWGPAGVELAPFDVTNESFQRCVPDGAGGAVVLWFEQPGATPPKRVLAQRVDAAGTPQWTPGGVEVCSVLSAKDDIEVTVDAAGFVRACWEDERTDGGDVYAQNLNLDGSLGASEPGTAYCFGDGLDPVVTTPCPCANTGAPGHGCASSFNPAGARIAAHGSVAGDDAVLDGSGMNVSGNCIFLKGDADAPGGIVFGDGVRCTDGTLIRLRTKPLVSGAASFPDSADTVTLSARGSTPVGSGLTGHYTVYYRNAAAAFCPPATFNAAGGYRITW